MEKKNKVSEEVISAAIEVHRHLGPGLLESAYEECLCRELSLRGIPFERQKLLPVFYKGLALGCDYRMDLVVAGDLIVELKAIEAILPLHQSQLLTYMRLSGVSLGLILNFNVPVMKDGIKRMIL